MTVAWSALALSRFHRLPPNRFPGSGRCGLLHIHCALDYHLYHGRSCSLLFRAFCFWSAAHPRLSLHATYSPTMGVSTPRKRTPRSNPPAAGTTTLNAQTAMSKADKMRQLAASLDVDFNLIGSGAFLLKAAWRICISHGIAAEARRIVYFESKALKFQPPSGSFAACAQSAAAKHPVVTSTIRMSSAKISEAVKKDVQRIL